MPVVSLVRGVVRRLLHPIQTTRKVWKALARLLMPDFVLHRGYRLPPRELRGDMCGEAFRSDTFYLQSAVVEATRLPATLGYTRASRLVDVGCGLGRLATGMLVEFGDVEYLGIDPNRKFLDWCRKHIEHYHPTFRFVHYDVMNELYNPRGNVDGESIRLPVLSESADIVYLWGVFTNMGPEHVRIYVAELARITRKGGKIFLTAFVEDDVPEVSFNPASYVPYDCSCPLTVVRYNKQYLFSLFTQHGLAVEDFRRHGGMFPKQSEINLTKQSDDVPAAAGGVVQA